MKSKIEFIKSDIEVQLKDFDKQFPMLAPVKDTKLGEWLATALDDANAVGFAMGYEYCLKKMKEK